MEKNPKSSEDCLSQGKCNTCNNAYVETKNTIFYKRKLPEEKIILICNLLVEKNGAKAIERITGIHRDTISDIMNDLAKHAREVTKFLIKDVRLTKIQGDEMWSFAKNKGMLTQKIITQMNMAVAGHTEQRKQMQIQ